MNTAQKNLSGIGSTQKFTEIKDIKENVIILSGGNACLIIEVRASNFALLSKEEQDAKVFAYASLLNSLFFPIQILIKNKKLDISFYLRLLENEAQKAILPKENITPEQAQKISNYIRLYRDFVGELVKVNIVLDKNFYLVLHYSYLEKGVIGITAAPQKGQKATFESSARTTLQTKADSVLSQLSRLNLGARILEKEELIQLIYSIYNEGSEEKITEENIKAPIVEAQKTA